jgi:energy-coupling factor transporter transmembrane protein EcfT
VNIRDKLFTGIVFTFLCLFASVFFIRNGYANVSYGQDDVLNTLAMIFIGISTIAIIFIGARIGVNWLRRGISTLEKLFFISVFLFCGLFAPITIVYQMQVANLEPYTHITFLILVSVSLFLSFLSPKTQH